MEAHIPVLLKEVTDMMKAHEGNPQKFFDGTFGRGGHTRAIINLFPNINVVALDRDLAAIEYGKQTFVKELAENKISFICGEFGELSENNFDLMLLDLGVSSPQLDEGERGFSFYHDGPLDMRMDQSRGSTAAEVINKLSESELNEMFQSLGEINRPFRVVKAIVHDRREKPFLRTQELAGLIERVEGWQRKGHHPATRYFLALRLYVNRELEVLEESLPNLINKLSNHGRLLVITFHSLEDRIVKNIFKSHLHLGKLINKKVIIPEWEEQKKNSRARSAKLRGFERIFDKEDEE